ncbi:MAG: hypothetical protein LC772_08915 [Chloroflexi bacterium]|nr:hypothetical protein [Chloroflexota bacterium]
MPQLEIAGTGVGTLDLGRTRSPLLSGGKSSSSQINFSDSAILFSGAERLYRNGGIGSFTVGGLATDENNPGTTTGLFIHQAFLDYQTRPFEAYVGRTDQPTAQIVTFPTLRGDDLLTFTNLLDPFSNGNNTEEHRYSNVAAATFNQGLRTFENIHVQHLIDSAGLAGAGDTGLNSYGASYQWLNLPGLQTVQHIISYGGGYEHRSLGKIQGGASDALYGGGVLNIRRGVTSRLDFRAQDILTFGNSLGAFRNISDTYAANSNALAAAVRYLRTPFGVPGYQLSLTAGYRSYQKVSNAGSYGLALTGVKRLGQGFDAVVQYLYQHRNGALAATYGGASSDQGIQIGFIFNYDATVNHHLGPRRTLTNLEHQYIPD